LESAEWRGLASISDVGRTALLLMMRFGWKSGLFRNHVLATGARPGTERAVLRFAITLVAAFPATSKKGAFVTDKKKMPADGGGIAKGKPDGVSGSPDTGEVGGVHGRSSGGESGGGAYPNPHSGKGPTHSRFSGGQTAKAYYGGDNPNATTKPHKSLEEAQRETRSQGPVPAERETHNPAPDKDYSDKEQPFTDGEENDPEIDDE
jgi:hypothetical protein